MLEFWIVWGPVSLWSLSYMVYFLTARLSARRQYRREAIDSRITAALGASGSTLSEELRGEIYQTMEWWDREFAKLSGTPESKRIDDSKWASQMLNGSRRVTSITDGDLTFNFSRMTDPKPPTMAEISMAHSHGLLADLEAKKHIEAQLGILTRALTWDQKQDQQAMAGDMVHRAPLLDHNRAMALARAIVQAETDEEDAAAREAAKRAVEGAQRVARKRELEEMECFDCKYEEVHTYASQYANRYVTYPCEDHLKKFEEIKLAA